MDDLIRRADAINAINKQWLHGVNVPICEEIRTAIVQIIFALPSAEAKPTIIRSKTLMPTKDFKEWAKRVREENPNAVVIPCDAEVASAEAVQGEWKRVPTRTYKGECTNCGFRHIFMDGHDSQYRFCPNCGAKMKGGDSE